MVYHFYLEKHAFSAVINNKKTIEVRLKGNKSVSAGDYIVFTEHMGTEKVCVRVDEVKAFGSIYELIENTDYNKWSFSPEDVFERLIKREFFDENKDKQQILAIYFSMPKISVVMPVFNSEAYLSQALDSLATQTYKNFEIVIIDDGSTDESIKIAEKYQVHLPIMLFKNGKNLGAAYSRNRGIDLSNGEYIIFLDSDDLFSPLLFFRLIRAAEKQNVDIAIAEYDSFFKNKMNPSFDDNESLPAHSMSKKPFSFEDIPDSMRYLINVPWNKLFRKDFIKNNNLKFQNIPSSNDVCFCNMAMILGRIIHTETASPLIHYRVFSKNGISSNRNPFNEHEAYLYLIKQLKLRNIAVTDKVLDNYLYGIFHYIKSCNSEYKKDYFEFVKNAVLNGNDILPSKYVAENHFYAVELFRNYDLSDSIFSLKLEAIEMLFDKESILKKTENLSEIGIFGTKHYEIFLRFYENDFERIINVDSDCITEHILSFSPLQTKDIRSFLSDKNINDITIIELYN